MEGFSIEIISAPDRDYLIAEIWYQNKFIAEINQELGKLEIEFYEVDTLCMDYKLFVEALSMAEQKLIKGEHGQSGGKL